MNAYVALKGHKYLFLMFIASASFLSACERSHKDNAELQSYTHNGVSLHYPASWVLSYDDTPALYADRAIGFQVSEFSTVSVLIQNTSPSNQSALVDRFERELQLLDGEYVKGYHRTSIEIVGFKGEKLTWKDTMIGSSEFELTVLTVIEKPSPVYAVFQLSDSDIETYTPYKANFVKNISLL